MEKIIFFILICLCCLCHGVPALAASAAKQISEGNRLYNEKKYDEAVEKYNAAAEEVTDSDIANFNLGAALYKKGQYREAVDAFTKALNTEDRGIEADAVYNMANSKYRLGKVTAEQDLNSAVQSYRESLDYYKRAIELNEKNSDARYNHELVEKDLKVLLDKIKNQPPQQQDRKDQDKNKKEGQKNQQDQTGSGDEQKEEKGKEEQTEQPQADKKDEENRSGENKEQQEAAEQQVEPEEMSPEEARMLLDAYGKEEAMDELKKQQRGQFPGVVKDW